MRILAIVDAIGHVCYRYRIQAFEPALLAAGCAVDVVPVPHSVREWASLLNRIPAYDAVVLQRKLLPPWYLWALRRAARRLVFDIDDAVFYRDSNSPKNPQSRQRWLRFKATVRRSDAVLAGNHFLAEQAAACSPVGAVIWMPTCVETQKYEVASQQRHQNVQLVWIGSRSTLPSLVEAEPCLTAASTLVPDCELRVVCDVFPTMDKVRVVPCVWSAATDRAELSAADIGVSWLPDHPWSRGKCGLKVLQYMAAGLPVIANPVGVHPELVEPGRTGFLATTPEEWATAVAKLAKSPELRREMGLRARQVVEQKFGVESRAAEFVAAVTGRASSSTVFHRSVTPVARDLAS